MTPVAELIAQHLHARIVAAVSPIQVMDLDEPLNVQRTVSEMVRVEIVDDVIEEERSTIGVQGAVSMALEIDVVVFAKSSADAALQGRTLSAVINTALVADHGVGITDDGARYRVETAGDESDADADGEAEVSVCRTQYSVLYRYRRDNPAIAA